MNHRFAKAFHLITVLAFIVIFMYIYSGLPEMVGFELNEEGFAHGVMNKNIFFYIVIGIFLVLNILLVTPAKLIESGASPNIKKLFAKGDPFREQMLTWIYSFVGIINVSIIVVVMYLFQLNGTIEETGRPSGLGLYILPVLFVIWTVILFILLTRKMKSVQSNK
ncbi:DNA topoisomerase IV [Echinicola soli]|uniref:DNA topoisomerase IV n=1 Tax=Echinicola soli TaxID=2591634 RepID=A0A514CLH4_9BACT|nr:DNA topoisomerase IV [Echinicola soli]QDH80650.1 DNA topoisomerase IV [Echinicola soli]